MAVLTVLLFLGASGPAEAGWSFLDDLSLGCRQHPDAYTPPSKRWYRHIGAHGERCWRLRTTHSKSEGEQKTALHQAPSSNDHAPTRSGEQPIWALPYTSINGNSEPSAETGLPAAPNFSERWQTDAVPAAMSGDSSKAGAASTAELDAMPQPKILLAASPRQSGWSATSFALVILFAAFAAALIFGCALYLRHRTLRTLFRRDQLDDGAFSLPVEVKLIPDLAPEAPLSGPDLDGRTHDRHPSDQLDHSMALYVPAKYRSQLKEQSHESPPPGSPEFDATLTDLLRRLREPRVTH